MYSVAPLLYTQRKAQEGQSDTDKNYTLSVGENDTMGVCGSYS